MNRQCVYPIAARSMFFAAIVCLASAPHRAFAELPRPAAILLADGEVVLEPGKVLDKASVIVRNGVIEAVGAKVGPPPDALRIDCTGLVIHAGLIDAGSSWGYDRALRPTRPASAPNLETGSEAYAATPEGSRRLMTPDFLVSQAVRMSPDEIEPWRLVGVTARLVAPAGGILAGQSALVSLSAEPLYLATIRDRAVMHLAFAREGNEYPATLMGMIAHLRQMLADADRHHRLSEAQYAGTNGIRVPADPALDALWPILIRKQRLAIAADTHDEIHRTLDLADEFRIDVVIVGGREAGQVKERLKQKRIPVIARLSFPDEPPIDRAKAPSKEAVKPEIPPGDEEAAKKKETPRERDVPKRVREDRRRRWLENLKGWKELLESGVPIAFALEGLKPQDAAKNLQTLCEKAGFDKDVILECLTLNPARILGVEEQLGSIAKGKLAHLVVRKGMPGEKDSWVRVAVIDGRLFEYAPVPAAKEERPTAKKSSDADEKSTTKAAPKSEDAPKTKPESAEAAQKQDDIADDVATELDSDRAPRRKTDGNVLLSGATIITVADEGDIESGDILVTSGRIARIGADLAPPEGTPIFDARGLFVMPGIIDTHSHMAISAGINESTLSITPEVRIKDVINSKDVTIYRALAGGATTARVLHGSANTIGGQDAVIKLKYGKPARELILEGVPQGVKFALGENVTRRQDRFPNSRLGVEALLIRAFSEADKYRKDWEEYRRKTKNEPQAPPPRRDDRLEVLAKVLSGEVNVHCHSYRQDEILMLLRVADRFGFKVRSLQHGLEGYKVAPEIAAHGASISTFSDWWAYKWEAYDATPFNTALLRRAGVSVCLKSDSNELVRHMNVEAAKMLRYGFDSPQDALETVTIIPAKQLGLERRLGSIEVGKDADLAVFSGHPLDGYSRCVMTLVDGEAYFEDREFWKDYRPAPKLNADHDRRPLPADDDDIRAMWRRGDRDRTLELKHSPGDQYLLRGATIHPVEGETIERGDVLIRAGKIAAVGEDIELRHDATVIDVGGLHVYPGLIDAGTKVGLVEVRSARETIDHNEGGLFQPDLRAATAINPDSEVIPVTRAGGVTTVLTMPASGIIAGQSSLVNLAGWVPNEMVVLDPVALHVNLPAAPEKPDEAPKAFTGRGRLASMRARRLEELRSLFRLAEQYRRGKEEASRQKKNSPVIEPRLEALIPYVSKERPVIFRADAARDILEAIDAARELRVRPIVSGARDAWKVRDRLKSESVSLIVGPVMTLPGEEYDPYDAPYRNPARLHEAGITFCIQSDGTSNARNLPFEAAMAVAYGLPADAALKAVTLYPAKILGIEKSLGSIAEGKTANLIITDGDPLQASTRIKGLFIAGQPLEPTSKHTRLYERYLERIDSKPPPARNNLEPKAKPVPL